MADLTPRDVNIILQKISALQGRQASIDWLLSVDQDSELTSEERELIRISLVEHYLRASK